MKILFWDIDGTLIRTARAGMLAFEQATRDLYGQDADYGQVAAAGMTDCHIATRIIAQLTGQQPSPKVITALIRRYEELLPAYLSSRPGEVIAPLQEILHHVAERPDFVQLLLTGNTTVGAKIKLTHFAVAQYFDFSGSAFGDDCHERNHVAAAALKTVRERYPALPLEDVYVIGDTPNDIRCGKSIGARTIAVATGIHPLTDLVAHTPWWAVERLPSSAEFVRKLE